MKTNKALLFLAGTVFTGLAAIATFNYWVNPLCFFRCESVSLGVQTVNTYYENAQRILQYPDTELIVLGSSRGESLPLAWLAENHRLKALNLSVGGAEINAKGAFLAFAKSKLRLKKVIWIADYFELIDATAADKIKYTGALRRHAPDLETLQAAELSKKLSLLLDHNMLEASFSLLKKKRKGIVPPDKGTSAEKDESKCLNDISKSRLTTFQLTKEIGIIFDGYAHRILQPLQAEKYYLRLKELAESTSKNKIEFILLIPGYHPAFWARLQKDFPEIAGNHENWVKRLTALERPGIRVLNFFGKLPGDDGSPTYWTDGVHFTCYSAMKMMLSP